MSTSQFVLLLFSVYFLSNRPLSLSFSLNLRFHSWIHFSLSLSLLCLCVVVVVVVVIVFYLVCTVYNLFGTWCEWTLYMNEHLNAQLCHLDCTQLNLSQKHTHTYTKLFKVFRCYFTIFTLSYAQYLRVSKWKSKITTKYGRWIRLVWLFITVTNFQSSGSKPLVPVSACALCSILFMFI